MVQPGQTDLSRALGKLRVAAGNPSIRQIAAGAQLPSSSVHNALRGAVPSRQALTRIVEYLAGDPRAFQQLREQVAATRRGPSNPDVGDFTDRCLEVILAGSPVPVRLLSALSPRRAALLAQAAQRLGVPLEVGTADEWVTRAGENAA